MLFTSKSQYPFYVIILYAFVQDYYILFCQ